MVLNWHTHLFVCWPRHIYSQMLCLAINIFIVMLYTCGDGTMIDTAMGKRVERLRMTFHSTKSYFILTQQTVNINYIFVAIIVLSVLSKITFYSTFNIYSLIGMKYRSWTQKQHSYNATQMGCKKDPSV